MIPRDIADRLRTLDLVGARPQDCYDAAWEINRGRWDISVAELAERIQERTGRGKVTLPEVVAMMKERAT